MDNYQIDGPRGSITIETDTGDATNSRVVPVSQAFIQEMRLAESVPAFLRQRGMLQPHERVLTWGPISERWKPTLLPIEQRCDAMISTPPDTGYLPCRPGGWAQGDPRNPAEIATSSSRSAPHGSGSRHLEPGWRNRVALLASGGPRRRNHNWNFPPHNGRWDYQLEMAQSIMPLPSEPPERGWTCWEWQGERRPAVSRVTTHAGAEIRCLTDITARYGASRSCGMRFATHRSTTAARWCSRTLRTACRVDLRLPMRHRGREQRLRLPGGPGGEDSRTAWARWRRNHKALCQAAGPTCRWIAVAPARLRLRRVRLQAGIRTPCLPERGALGRRLAAGGLRTGRPRPRLPKMRARCDHGLRTIAEWPGRFTTLRLTAMPKPCTC